ncbi:MAG: hypothetical protein ACRDMV_10550 [Streptosporangiales bacterium]
MSYRVEFALGAAMTFHTVRPSEAQDALIDRAADLTERPWADAMIRRPGNDPAFRESTFGAGRGICAFQVDEDADVVRIFEIVWVG